MNKMTFWAVTVMAAVTILLRALPFLLMGSRPTPKVITYLGSVLPYAVMGMLVVYCLKGVSFRSLAGFLPEMIASGVVIGSYLWKKNTLLSIVGGTVCYMLLVQFVFT